MMINRQKKVRIELRSLMDFTRRLRRRLELGKQDFNVCFVDDLEIAQLNRTYRGMPRPTDVLSFPWRSQANFGPKVQKILSSLAAPRAPNHKGAKGGPFDFSNFLGDVVISAEAARRNARGEGHSTGREIRWLIVHGALHLLGFDHDADRGEMKALELELREELKI